METLYCNQVISSNISTVVIWTDKNGITFKSDYLRKNKDVFDKFLEEMGGVSNFGGKDYCCDTYIDAKGNKRVNPKIIIAAKENQLKPNATPKGIMKGPSYYGKIGAKRRVGHKMLKLLKEASLYAKKNEDIINEYLPELKEQIKGLNCTLVPLLKKWKKS